MLFTECFNELCIYFTIVILEKLVEKTKVKNVIETIEHLLRATILLLQDTVSNIATPSETKCFPVDDVSSKTIFVESGEENMICVGESLCRILLVCWNKTYIMRSPSLLFDAVKCLFMCSQKAKISALEEGFVESIVEEMKDKLVKLKMESALNSNKEIKVILTFLFSSLNSSVTIK